ncbi:hypothetical protein ACQKKK_12395 [Peribacillus sp. NPDC006672]|uniref:hypothetical protein n=1 Tax=Peribacillus sp. NPDC006672 TaxID=3390606 RepID=UPI003CFE2583
MFSKHHSIQRDQLEMINTLEEEAKKLEKERQEKLENGGQKKAGRKPKESTTKI